MIKEIIHFLHKRSTKDIVNLIDQKISESSGTDDDAIHDNVAGEINSIAEKGTPVSGDWVLLEDSADSNNKKKAQAGNLPAGGGGEVNTASNAGSGDSLFYQKSTYDLEFNGIKSENDRIAIALDAGSHDIELTLTEGNIVHQNISGAGSNTHAQIDTHIGDSNNPHSIVANDLGADNIITEINDNGTGTIDAARIADGSDGTAIHDNVNGEVNAIAAKGTPVSGDLLVIEDSAASYAKKKITIGDLPGGGGGGLTVSGASVFSGSSPTSWQDLDLSGTIGEVSALVILSIAGDGDMNALAVRKNGDANQYYDDGIEANAYGCALAHHDADAQLVLICVTDTAGVIEWITETSQTSAITLIAYIT